jgi:predicted DCC family thiol-disulfide oxidoreductase YuxK
MERIILFDGICNLCNGSVRFIIKRDPVGYFKFSSLQSNVGKNLLEKYKVPNDINSFILLDNTHVYTKSSAALRVCLRLNGLWKILIVFIIIPKPIRDFIYDVIANNRYKWFGKSDHCKIPSPDEKERFFD